MKQKLTLLVLVLCLISVRMIGQTYTPDDPAVQKAKMEGKIAIPDQVMLTSNVINATLLENGSRDAGLFVPLDGTFTLAMQPNDDGFAGPFTLPFTFCYYGDNHNSFYINNNGNISFGGGFFNFTSTGFPTTGFPMIAPFWADVDTRSGLGGVYYKITATHAIIIWNATGYYNQQGDKRNTFELIITNGNDPLIGINKNVAFSYADMQWTTGSASGGSGGFGGTPATVGINYGDGVKFAQIGRFDHAGTDYDGAAGNNDGVSYLDYKTWVFDACVDNPVLTPVSNWAIFIGLALILGVFVLRYRRVV